MEIGARERDWSLASSLMRTRSRSRCVSESCTASSQRCRTSSRVTAADAARPRAPPAAGCSFADAALRLAPRVSSPSPTESAKTRVGARLGASEAASVSLRRPTTSRSSIESSPTAPLDGKSAAMYTVALPPPSSPPRLPPTTASANCVSCPSAVPRRDVGPSAAPSPPPPPPLPPPPPPCGGSEVIMRGDGGGRW